MALVPRRYKLIKQGLDDGAVLADLGDVASTTPTNGQALIWNGTEWVPGNAESIANFEEAAEDIIGAAITAGSGISVTYNDPAGTITIAMSKLGFQDLTDPNADRILFWDDSAGTTEWLTAGTGLAITTTTLALSFLGLETLTDPNGDRLMFWDDSEGSLAWLSLGSGLTITGTTITASGGSAADPNESYSIYWEFTERHSTTQSVSASWTTETFGTGGATSHLHEDTAPGIARCTCGTGNPSGGRYAWEMNTTSGDHDTVIPPPGATQLNLRFRVRVNTLPTGTVNYDVSMGCRRSFVNSNSLLIATMRHSGSAAVWGLTVRSSGGATTTDNYTTGPTISANTWYEVEIRATTSTIQLYVDGSLVGTLSSMTNIPTEGMHPYVQIASTTTGNSGNRADFDYAWAYKNLSSAR